MLRYLSVATALSWLLAAGGVQANELWQRFENLNPSSATLTDECSKTFAVAEPRPGHRTLFIGDCQQGNWQPVAPFTVSASELVYVDGTLMAFNPDLWQSADDGQSWQRVESVGTTSIRPFKGADERWYVQSSNGLFRFDAGARTWQSLALAAFPDTVEKLLRFGVNSQGEVLALVFLTERENFELIWQIFSYSTSQGSWQPQVPRPVSSRVIYPMTLHISPEDDIWVGAQFDFLSRYDVTSQQWQTIDRFDTGLNIGVAGLGVLQMNFADEGIYVLTGEPQIGSSGVLFSADKGENWHDLTAELGLWQKLPMKHMQFDAQGRLNVFTSMFGFYQLDNDSKNWLNLDKLKPIQVDYVFRLPGNSLLALARGEGWGPFSSYGVWRSDDNGTSWYAAERGLVDRAGGFKGVTQNHQGDVFVSIYAGAAIYQYTPTTNEWQLLSRNEVQFWTLGSITSYQNTIIGGAYFEGGWQYDLATSQWRHIQEGLPTRRGGELFSGLTNLLSTDKGVFALALDQEANDGIYFKPHATQTWQRVVNQPAHILSMLSLSANRVLAVEHRYHNNAWVANNYVTADSGDTWQVFDERIQGAVIAYAQSVDGKTQAFLTEDRQGFPYQYRVYLLEEQSQQLSMYPVPERVSAKALLFSSEHELLVFSSRGYLSLDLSIHVIAMDTRLQADTTIEGDVFLQAGVLDLNGFTLTITGSLYHSGGELRVSAGRLVIVGDYRLEASATSGSEGLLLMVQPGDVVLVGADFVMDSNRSHQGALSDGVLQIDGHFYQRNTAGTLWGNYNFAPSDSHITRLTGSAVNVSFAAHWASYFQHLEVARFAAVQFNTQYHILGDWRLIKRPYAGSRSSNQLLRVLAVLPEKNN